MHFYGCIVVEKRSGADGSTFPLINEDCLLGRAEGCDIQIRPPIVSKVHAKLKVQVNDGLVNITTLSKTNNIKLNGVPIPKDTPVLLYQSDIFTIGDRHFRWEYPNGSRLSKAKRTQSRDKKEVGPSNEVLPTICIYASLILVLGAILGKFVSEVRNSFLETYFCRLQEHD